MAADVRPTIHLFMKYPSVISVIAVPIMSAATKNDGNMINNGPDLPHLPYAESMALSHSIAETIRNQGNMLRKQGVGALRID